MPRSPPQDGADTPAVEPIAVELVAVEPVAVELDPVDSPSRSNHQSGAAAIARSNHGGA
jgi:hypothetical protein